MDPRLVGTTSSKNSNAQKSFRWLPVLNEICNLYTLSVFIICRVSAMVGGVLSFQCRTMLSLAANRMWDTITLIWVGLRSMSSDRNARPGEGATFIPVTCSITRKMQNQYFSIRGHVHIICSSVPVPPQFLQNSEDVPGANFDMRYGVRYHFNNKKKMVQFPSNWRCLPLSLLQLIISEIILWVKLWSLLCLSFLWILSAGSYLTYTVPTDL